MRWLIGKNCPVWNSKMNSIYSGLSVERAFMFFSRMTKDVTNCRTYRMSYERLISANCLGESRRRGTRRSASASRRNQSSSDGV
jgi:hypothetical protein